MRLMCRAGTATACRSNCSVEKKHGKAIPPAQFRELCRDYATEQIERQKKDFIRLGVMGDWDHPYLTMDFKTEADIIRALGKIHERGYLYQGYKPVNWCLDCQSALAEAEVEYEDKVSAAIDVGFEVKDKDALDKAFGVSLPGDAKVYAVIWTTTPWTLPANQAVCVHPELQYDLIRTEKGYLILAFDLATQCLARYQLGGSNDRGDGMAATCKGAALEGLPLQHPFYERIVPDHLRRPCHAGSGYRPGAHRTGAWPGRLCRRPEIQSAERQPGRRRWQVHRHHAAESAGCSCGKPMMW